MNSARMSRFLPLQVAAVCYRRRGTDFEFLLVNTTSGNKWTLPKGVHRATAIAQPGRRTRGVGGGRSGWRHRTTPFSPPPTPLTAQWR